MKQKKNSKFKNLLVLVVIIGAGFFFYKFFLEGQSSGFNIDTGNAFGTPSGGEKKQVDSEGHTEDFWTNNKFKW